MTRNSLKNLFHGALTTLWAVMLAGLAQAASWDMATPYPDKTFHTVNISQFAADVDKATGGKLAIKIHSAGSLFKHPEIKNAVRGGQIPIGEFYLGLLANENPIFGADTLPFLATDYASASKLWAAQRPYVEALLDKQGLAVLYAVPWPPQGLYTKKAITSADDLRGLKFRSYNANLERLAQLAGASPTQIEVPDLPQAFSTGRVEAMITSPTTGANSKAWDYLSHYTDIQAWVPKNIVVVNKRALRALPKDQQDAIRAAAAKAEKRGWDMSRAETQEKTGIMRDNNMAVVQPSAELMAGLKKIGATMADEWKAKAGAEGAAFLKSYAER